MKKTLIGIMFLLIALILTGCESATSAADNSVAGSDRPAAVKSGTVASDQPTSSAELVADKLEVYYFHRTARCYSCNTAGEYIRDLMAAEYADQIKDGRMVFAEVNVELPENKELARKFQATGSSLYINRIIDGRHNIEQETNIWRYLGDEAQFKQYLSNKINADLNI